MTVLLYSSVIRSSDVNKTWKFLYYCTANWLVLGMWTKWETHGVLLYSSLICTSDGPEMAVLSQWPTSTSQTWSPSRWATIDDIVSALWRRWVSWMGKVFAYHTKCPGSIPYIGTMCEAHSWCPCPNTAGMFITAVLNPTHSQGRRVLTSLEWWYTTWLENVKIVSVASWLQVGFHGHAWTVT